ncbi:TlpA family protein disulfide reductase [Halalkalibacter lacteus]|uniref:TlpA family protein disulfide reductase n=1 Tax=Halalkalibacter lacteus TaxID=3090663 RepID=UPI002FC619C8
MDGVWMLGPFIIKQMWLTLVLLFAAGFYLSVHLVKEDNNQAKTFTDLYWNGVIYFFLIFQFSSLLVYPMISIRDPIAVLSMPSGAKEWMIAWGFLVVYIFWKTKKASIVRINIFIHIIVSYLVVETVYFAFYSFDSSGYPVSLFQMIANIGLLLLFFIQKQKQSEPQILFYRLVVLYGAIMGVLSLIVQVRMIVTSVPSWFYFILVFAGLIGLNRIKENVCQIGRNDNRGIVVIGVLVLLVGWSSFNVALKDAKEIDSSLASSIAVGHKAPDFTLHNLDGKEISLSDFKGEPVMINFWATWCPPCRAELPDMERFYTTQDVVLLAVNGTNTESSKAHVEDFVDEMGLSFPVLADLDGEVASLFQIRPLPTSLFVDENGIISDIHIGPLNQELMIRKLDQLNIEQ